MKMPQNAKQKFTFGNKADSYGMQSKGQRVDVEEPQTIPKGGVATPSTGKRVSTAPTRPTVVAGTRPTRPTTPTRATGASRKLGNHF
jgi:hypothetical protein